MRGPPAGHRERPRCSRVRAGSIVKGSRWGRNDSRSRYRDCACAGSECYTLERALRGEPGVVDGYVNPVTQTAYIDYDPASSDGDDGARLARPGRRHPRPHEARCLAASGSPGLDWATMRAGRLLTILTLTLFAVSTTLDAALERAPVASTHGPSHNPGANPPCAGLCGCHAACVQIDTPNAISFADAPAARPMVAPPSAPESRAPEVIPPPPKP